MKVSRLSHSLLSCAGVDVFLQCEDRPGRTSACALPLSSLFVFGHAPRLASSSPSYRTHFNPHTHTHTHTVPNQKKHFTGAWVGGCERGHRHQMRFVSKRAPTAVWGVRLRGTRRGLVNLWFPSPRLDPGCDGLSILPAFAPLHHLVRVGGTVSNSADVSTAKPPVGFSSLARRTLPRASQRCRYFLVPRCRNRFDLDSIRWSWVEPSPRQQEGKATSFPESEADCTLLRIRVAKRAISSLFAFVTSLQQRHTLSDESRLTQVWMWPTFSAPCRDTLLVCRTASRECVEEMLCGHVFRPETELVDWQHLFGFSSFYK